MKSIKRFNLATVTISIILVASIVFTGFNALCEEWTTEQKEIWSLVENGWEVLKSGDFKTDMVVRHDKMLVLYSDSPSPYNKSQEGSVVQRWMASDYKPTSYKLKPIAVNIVEDVAIVFYLHSWHSEINDFTAKGRTMSTYLKQNNTWVFIGSLSASGDKPAPCPYGW